MERVEEYEKFQSRRRPGRVSQDNASAYDFHRKLFRATEANLTTLRTMVQYEAH